MTESSSEALDLREIGAALRRGRLWIAAGALLGLLAGASALALLRPEYEGTATVLLRSQADGGQSMLSRLSGMMGGLPAGLGGGGSEVETEVKILTSRTVIGEVVDSLGLQAEVLEPAGTAPTALFAELRAGPEAAGAVYRFERTEGGYAVEGPGASGVAVPGEPYRVPGGVLVLRPDPLPAGFRVVLLDREEAVTRVEDALVTEVSGEYVEIAFRAADPPTASAVPNALVAEYLRRRKTTDRGVNQHRYEFLAAHTDSIAGQLALAEGALRRHQEVSGVLDPKLTGEVGVERAMQLRTELETAATESRALEGIIRKGASGSLSPRELAAYPTFLRNPAVNDMVSRLLELETERVILLEKRTERDPEVVALSDGIRHLESRLVELSRDYLSGLGRQEVELRRELAGYQAELDALPGHAEESLRRMREVKRLSETLIVLQTQLVQARLEAISEGGEVRQVDVAVPPREPAFPNPALTLLGGLLGGLFFGTVAAVGTGRRRARLAEPWEAELAAGAAAVPFDPRLPLSFPELGRARTVLVLPVGPAAEARAVGERLAATAGVQGREAVLADLTRAPSAPSAPASRLVAVGGEGYSVYHPAGDGGAAAPRHAALEELEERYARVVAVLPGIEDPAAVSVLAPERPVVVAARAGRVTREELREAVGICRRLGVEVAGVVLHPPAGRRGRGA